jgi:hypothetical protein
MATPPPGVGRPRTRSKEEPRQYVGGQIPARLKRLLECAAKANGRPINAEFVSQLEQSLAAYPPEIAALAELIARTMTETGDAISGVDREAGHGFKRWLVAPYAYSQAVGAAIRVLQKSLPDDSAEPEGWFAKPEYPRERAEQVGKQMADSILEVMFGRNDDDTTVALWAPRMLENLGVIGDRLARHPPAEDYIGPPTIGPGRRGR